MESKSRHRHKRWVALALHAVGASKRPNKQRSTLAEVVGLAWPIATAMIGETAIGLVDTKLVGGLGAAALGGVGVANTLMFLSYALVFGTMRGVKIRTAYAVGRGTPEDGVAYARAGVLMGSLFGLVVWFVGRDVTWALQMLAVDPLVIPSAREFFAAITWGAPATCALAALIQHRQGLGDARSPMVVGIAGNVVNAVLAWTMIYGHFGVPALGVCGAGYGTATVGLLWASAVIAEIALFAVGPRLLARYPLSQLLRVALASTVLRWVLVAAYPQVLLLQFGAQLLHLAGFGLFHSVTVLLGPALLPGGAPARAQALVSSLGWGAGGMAGSLMAGFLWDRAGPRAVFIGSALVAASAWLLAWRAVHGPAGPDRGSFGPRRYAPGGTSDK